MRSNNRCIESLSLLIATFSLLNEMNAQQPTPTSEPEGSLDEIWVILGVIGGSIFCICFIIACRKLEARLSRMHGLFQERSQGVATRQERGEMTNQTHASSVIEMQSVQNNTSSENEEINTTSDTESISNQQQWDDILKDLTHLKKKYDPLKKSIEQIKDDDFVVFVLQSIKQIDEILNRFDIPRGYICLYTQEIMDQPALTDDGHNYEYSRLVTAEAMGGKCCTDTSKRVTTILPNTTLKIEITEFLNHRKKDIAELTHLIKELRLMLAPKITTNNSKLNEVATEQSHTKHKTKPKPKAQNERLFKSKKNEAEVNVSVNVNVKMG